VDSDKCIVRAVTRAVGSNFEDFWRLIKEVNDYRRGLNQSQHFFGFEACITAVIAKELITVASKRALSVKIREKISVGSIVIQSQPDFTVIGEENKLLEIAELKVIEKGNFANVEGDLKKLCEIKRIYKDISAFEILVEVSDQDVKETLEERSSQFLEKFSINYYGNLLVSSDSGYFRVYLLELELCKEDT